MTHCQICKGEISETFRVREMLYGHRNSFVYGQCGECGCLQIAEIPADLAEYYPQDYYSLQGIEPKRRRLVRDFIRRSRALFEITGKGLIGRFLALLKEPDPKHLIYRRIGLKISDHILDIGGGAGEHVLSLHRIGFKNAISVDPFIDEDVILDGVKIAQKSEIFSLDGNYDYLFFHHSLEHMAGQLGILAKAAELIGDTGRILIRIPTVSSTAWQTYKTDWVNLDAPRHLFLHSHDSIRLLAQQAKLQVIDFWQDSEAMQFWGSEQYRQDIPLNDPRSYSINPEASPFSAADIRSFQQHATKLNQAGKGDWICVLLSK